MKKPIILITAGPAFDRQFHTEGRVLNKTYTSAIASAGGLPIMDLDAGALDDYAELADGCVFTGTQGFTPDATLSLHSMQVERISREHELMRKFLAKKKPVLAICQGFQQLNVALGGDLRIDFRKKEGVEHSQIAHTIKTTEGSFINRMFGSEFLVNSLHNVRVGKLAPELKATAFSPDGVIEAYEHETLPVYGFQWHPERMRGDFSSCPYGPDTDLLFKTFVKMCEETHK